MEYLTCDLNDLWACDIEGDGLYETITKVHILCAENIGTGETFESTDPEAIRDFVQMAPYLVGHNFLSFDLPVLNRLCGCRRPIVGVVDTLVLSWLYSPKLLGGHSLESYGERFKEFKTGLGITDWSELTEEMKERCRGDVKLTKKVYLSLRKKMLALGFTNQSVYIQHAIRVIMEKQRRAGFAFDERKAVALYAHLRQRCKEIEAKIHVLFPPVLKEVKRAKYKLLKSGEENSHIKRYRECYPRVQVEGEECICFDYVPFNLGSPQQRIEKLLGVGWVPDAYTKTGQPKITEDSVHAFLEDHPDEQAVGELIRWMSYNGRANMISNWLDALGKDGRIHGNIWVAGSLRFRHDKPNTANVPRVRRNKKTKEILLGEDGFYTYEARSCWVVSDPKKRRLVGADAKGLEFRMLAHEVDNEDFTKQVCDGDVHDFMMKAYELDDRDNGKTVTYAIIYGGQDPKIGSIVGGTAKDGKRIRSNAYKNLPGLEEVVKRATDEFYLGRIELVDGSRTICPSKHSALNYKLQGGGARVMALGAIILDAKVRRLKLDAYKVGDIHDEWQWDCAIEDVERLRGCMLESFTEAGEQLGLRVKIEGSTAVGLNWGDTH